MGNSCEINGGCKSCNSKPSDCNASMPTVSIFLRPGTPAIMNKVYWDATTNETCVSRFPFDEFSIDENEDESSMYTQNENSRIVTPSSLLGQSELDEALQLLDSPNSFDNNCHHNINQICPNQWQTNVIVNNIDSNNDNSAKNCEMNVFEFNDNIDTSMNNEKNENENTIDHSKNVIKTETSLRSSINNCNNKNENTDKQKTQLKSMINTKKDCSTNVKKSQKLKMIHEKIMNAWKNSIIKGDYQDAVKLYSQCKEYHFVFSNFIFFDGCNPLHMSIKNKSHRLTIFLLSTCQINVNSTNIYNNKTALHYACENNDILMTKMLLRVYNAYPNAIDKNGMSPLHIAKKLKNFKIQQLLKHAQLPVSYKHGHCQLYDIRKRDYVTSPKLDLIIESDNDSDKNENSGQKHNDNSEKNKTNNEISKNDKNEKIEKIENENRIINEKMSNSKIVNNNNNKNEKARRIVSEERKHNIGRSASPAIDMLSMIRRNEQVIR